MEKKSVKYYEEVLVNGMKKFDEDYTKRVRIGREYTDKELSIILDNMINYVRAWANVYGSDKKFAVAISGGLDSTITATILVKALSKDRVIGIKLPCGVQEDIDYSNEIIADLGIEAVEFNILALNQEVITQFSNLGVVPTEQARINVNPRLRMMALYFYAQCNNAIPVNTCNLSENWVGYSTIFGDGGTGAFSILEDLTKPEIKRLAYMLLIKKRHCEKDPADGLCGKNDEENLGFAYDEEGHYIRTGLIEDLNKKAKIDRMHKASLFKLKYIDYFSPSL